MTHLIRNKLTLIINSESSDGAVPPRNTVFSDCATHGSETERRGNGNKSADNYYLQDSTLQSALVAALEQATGNSWRMVCASLATEQSEPYRTCFLSKEVRNLLQLWNAWQNCDICASSFGFDKQEKIRSENFCPQSLMIDVDLYRPLELTASGPVSQ